MNPSGEQGTESHASCGKSLMMGRVLKMLVHSLAEGAGMSDAGR